MARIKQDYVIIDPKEKGATITIENMGLIPILARVRSVNMTAYVINPAYYLIAPGTSQNVFIEIRVARHIDTLHDTIRVGTLTVPQKMLECLTAQRNGDQDLTRGSNCRALWEEIVATYNPTIHDIIVPTRSVGVLGTYQEKLMQDSDDLNALREEIERLLGIRRDNDKLLRDIKTKGVVIQARKYQLVEKISTLNSQLDALGISRVMGQVQRSQRILAHYLFIVFLVLASTLCGYALL